MQKKSNSSAPSTKNILKLRLRKRKRNPARNSAFSARLVFSRSSFGVQKWAVCRISRPSSSLEFLILSPSPNILQDFFKCKVQVQWKSKKGRKDSFLNTKIPHMFPFNSIRIRSWCQILEAIYIPDPIQIWSLVFFHQSTLVRDRVRCRNEFSRNAE